MKRKGKKFQQTKKLKGEIDRRQPTKHSSDPWKKNSLGLEESN